MRVFVIMWILSLTDLQGQKTVYDGTIDDCLREALEFNATGKQAYAGCYVDVKQQNFVPREERRPRGQPPLGERSW